MIRKISILTLCFLLTGLSVVLFPGKTYAYLDPGTGSYILQILIAVFLGGAFMFKSFFGKIKTWFKHPGSQTDKDTDPDA